MLQTTRKKKGSKPGRPYPDFPLFPHQNGQWAKKIRGRLHYFGLLADPDAALEKYQQQRDDLHAGRTPRTTADGLTVRDLVNRFLTAKQQLVDSGELAPRSFADYHATGARVVAAFGRDRLVIDLAADDFEGLRSIVAKSWGPVALGNEITRVRVLFNYAYDAGLIDRPVRYGPQFKRPSKKVLRTARHEKGPRMFSAADVKALLKSATRSMKAMILLGLNAGFGNADLGTLPLSAIDLKGRWINYPRPKTEIARRVPLWPETLKALKEAIAARPTPKDPNDDHLAFLTKYGLRWAKDTRDNPISKEFAKLLEEVGLKRPGLSFYALRHTFETIGGEARGQVAVDAIMGHAPHSGDMSAIYRERVTDERLKAVTEHVRKWLFAKAKTRAKKKPAATRKASRRLRLTAG